ncbi:hypothetical protein NDU88_004615 [Pleurodeles waltl]|uniref:Uncharacterized protein n=1 Tax=Pleurodeles waltl TaxID=8319 RepID=A0AAV7TT35_PLEWA|nr:hypothetical protein NDU88_004615 [Pleurodeles waltl]
MPRREPRPRGEERLAFEARWGPGVGPGGNRAVHFGPRPGGPGWREGAHWWVHLPFGPEAVLPECRRGPGLRSSGEDGA